MSGRGLCDELITRPEESYRLWCIVVCDLENLKNEEAMTRVGSQCQRKKIIMSKLLVVPCIEKYFKFISQPTLSQLLLISICFCSP